MVCSAVWPSNYCRSRAAYPTVRTCNRHPLRYSWSGFPLTCWTSGPGSTSLVVGVVWGRSTPAALDSSPTAPSSTTPAGGGLDSPSIFSVLSDSMICHQFRGSWETAWQFALGIYWLATHVGSRTRCRPTSGFDRGSRQPGPVHRGRHQYRAQIDSRLGPKVHAAMTLSNRASGS
jgi:hypothetical protein